MLIIRYRQGEAIKVTQQAIEVGNEIVLELLDARVTAAGIK